MARWFSSDWHLGHLNIIRFCGRPFETVEQMNQAIVAEVYAKVQADDELWLLGDVAMGNLDRTLALVATLPGRITLVAGNHDKIHPGRAKNEHWVEEYQNRCPNITAIHQRGTSISLDGHELLVNHYPYAGSDARPGTKNGKEVEDRFAEYRYADEGGWLLCGHVHQNWQQDGRMINVGVDAWGGRLVSEEDIRRVLQAGPGKTMPPAWTLQ